MALTAIQDSKLYTFLHTPLKGVIGPMADQLWLPCGYHYILRRRFALKSTLLLFLRLFCALMADSI
jgi:hypothetical protein